MKDTITTLAICFLAFNGLKIIYDILKHNELQKRKKQYYKTTGKRIKQK